MGAVQAPNLCAGGVMHNTDGATFDVTVTAGAHSGQLGFQFHYRVPVAEGKANTDCTNANDRNHTTACQAKWSGTASI
jgi:hypothetical protein